MTLIKILAIFIFDLIDKYIHQNNILKSLKKEKLDIKIFIDIGAHKGKYTDLILNNFNLKNVYLFEPQQKLLKFLRSKYRNCKKKSTYQIMEFLIKQKLKVFILMFTI